MFWIAVIEGKTSVWEDSSDDQWKVVSAACRARVLRRWWQYHRRAG